jgi:hypothetical protein
MDPDGASSELSASGTDADTTSDEVKRKAIANAKEK